MAQNVNPLSDFIDTAKYAEIICSNMDRLDEETKKKYAGMPESVRENAIREQLNKTTVYMIQVINMKWRLIALVEK